MTRTVHVISIVILLILLFVSVLGQNPFARYIIGKYYKYSVQNAQSLRSPVDGEIYRVHLAHTNPILAANLMAFLHKNVIEIMRYLRSKYIRGGLGGRYPGRKRVISNILMRYNPDNLIENSPRDPLGDTSYTIDKGGGLLALCLREKDPTRSGQYNVHGPDILMFVILHELSHIGIDENGHPPFFWSVFKMLLLESHNSGVYTGPDYAIAPTNYCGLTVNYSPLYDTHIPPPEAYVI